MATQEQQRIEDAKMLGRMSAQIDDMHKCLFGNGQPGLKEQFTIVKSNQERCKARLNIEEGLDVGRKNNTIGIYGLFVASGALIFSILAFFSKRG